MVTFHSYVSLPEGRWNNLTGHLLTRVIHHTSEMILEAMGITYLGAPAISGVMQTLNLDAEFSVNAEFLEFCPLCPIPLI